MSDGTWEWNAPPGWPIESRGWRPPEGWVPDPSWPPAPDGWEFWVAPSAAPPSSWLPAGADVDDTPSARKHFSRPFSRRFVGASSGLAGLLLGMLMASGGVDQDDLDAAEARADKQIALVQTESGEAVAAAENDLVAAKAAQEDAVEKAVASAVAAETAKRDTMIKDAVAKAQAEATAKAKAAAKPKAESKPQTLVAATDPRFGTCREANENGYGNYQQGVDPEYDWYQDRDGDGFVCE